MLCHFAKIQRLCPSTPDMVMLVLQYLQKSIYATNLIIQMCWPVARNVYHKNSALLLKGKSIRKREETQAKIVVGLWWWWWWWWELCFAHIILV